MKSNLMINGHVFEYDVKGDATWGEDQILFSEKNDILSKLSWGKAGFCVEKFLSESETLDLKAKIKVYLELLFSELAIPFDDKFNLLNYHQYVKSKADHQEVIERTRELRFDTLGLNSAPLVAKISTCLGHKVSSHVRRLNRDHIQLRISRPNSLDINPPHRDGYLDIWANVLNLWLPIVGCNEKSSLPVIPGSHLWSEKDVFRTKPGESEIDGNKYRVPAILDSNYGLNMIRPNPKEDEILIFTPFLIHGAAVNLNQETTRMALEFRFEIQEQCY